MEMAGHNDKGKKGGPAVVVKRESLCLDLY